MNNLDNNQLPTFHSGETQRTLNFTDTLTDTDILTDFEPPVLDAGCALTFRDNSLAGNSYRELESSEKLLDRSATRKITATVEYPVYEEVIKKVETKTVVSVPKEVVKYVPTKQVRVVKQEKYIKGEKIEVPKVIPVTKEVIIPRFVDVFVPTVVSQSIFPIIVENGYKLSVDTTVYEPKLVPIDVLVPKPVECSIVFEGQSSELLKEVEVPSAHYNTMLKKQNSKIAAIPEVYRDLQFRAELDGSIQFIERDETDASKLTLSVEGVPLTNLASSVRPVFPLNFREGGNIRSSLKKMSAPVAIQ